RRLARCRLIEDELRGDELALVPLAADHLQVLRREVAGESEEFPLRPLRVEKMIVAARALQLGAQEHLCDIRGALRRLEVVPVPDVAPRSSRRGTGEGRIDQLRRHLVEGAV